MMRVVDVHGGHGEPHAVDTSDIVVEATSPGFAPAYLKIPTSTDVDTDGVLAVAQAGAGKPVDFFGGRQ